ncbi:MAG: GDSL-type esterase/lipase family protein [Selenomonadaceae bacterium]|nr:GDSL-type esterase/lipase family protein [Selenomonadaceae bacterium]
MMLEATNQLRTIHIAPSKLHIQYFGRWDKTDANNYRCAQGAIYIKLNFTGTSIKAKLLDKTNYWKVSIDNGPFRKFRPAIGTTSLAENLFPGVHKLLLVRMTEGIQGISQFQGFILDWGADIVRPDLLKTRRIEFIGDSITAGAKNSPAPGIPNPGYYDIEDNDMAYGPQLARMLEADYSVLGVSGEGLIHQWDEIRPYNRVHTADRYKWTLYSDSFKDNQLWDPEQFPVDAVLICIGTNDFIDQKPNFEVETYADLDGRNRIPTQAEFIKNYTELLRTVRSINPEAAIICIEPVPDWVGADVRYWICLSINQLKAQGEKNIHYIPLNVPEPLLKEADYANDLTHPTAEGARKIALYLKDKVAAIMQWL